MAQSAARIQEMIRREKALLEGAKAMSASTSNATVLQQCRSNIRDAQANIAYLEKELANMTQPEAATPIDHANVTGLELLRYDNPFMGQRIQFMLQQLDFKLSLARQYKKGIEKLERLYSEEHDKQARDQAVANLAESTAKIELLRCALKRYTDLQLNVSDGLQPLKENVRRPVTGTLHLFISKIDGVDHTTFSASRNVETRLVLRIENQLVGQAAGRGDVFNEEFHVPIDKANELEIVAYDQAGQDSKPVAIMWIRINDVVEGLRRKGIQSRADKGWANADTVIREGSVKPASTGSAGTTNKPASTGSALTGPPITNPAPIKPIKPHNESIEGWFNLEPAGRIYMRLQFDKNTPQKQKVYRDGLGRHNAIVRKQEDATEIMGHQFVHQRFYNIMRCAICEEFIISSPFQCIECHFACHKHCVSKVVTKCISQISTETDQAEQLNHRIPHNWEPSSNMSANWCCHCGLILPFGKKKIRKCTECGIMCHPNCMRFVPNFCGMSMEMAAQILSAIRMTKMDPRRRGAAASHASSSTLVSSHSSQADTLASSLTGQTPPSPIKNPYLDGRPIAHQPSVHHNPPPPPPASQKVPRKKVPMHTKTSSDGSTDQNLELSLDLGNSSWWSDKTINWPETSPETPAVNHQRWSPDQPAGGNTAANVPAAAPPISAPAPTTRKTPSPPVPQHKVTPQQPKKSPQKSPVQPKSPPQVPAQKQLPQSPPPVPAARPVSVQPVSQVHSPPNATDAEVQEASASAALAAAEQLLKQKKAAGQPAPQPVSNAVAQRDHAHGGHHKRRPKVGLDDFSFLAVLGKGNFGKVMLAESKHTQKLYAIKVLKKNFIIDNKEVESTKSEKNVFLIANKERHPFLVNLYACFQTANRIYFVMDYVSGGDLMYHITKDPFSASRAQYYAAEVLLGLKHFHDNDVIYRDLKLDNILLTLDGHIKIADYGLCKEGMGFGKTTGTFCGTPDFIAPEILLDQKYGRSVDWWAFGVLMYQMLLGKSPFKGNDEDDLYDAILCDEPLYPIHMPKDSVSILQQLLERDPTRRLGCGPTDALEIMKHPYFANINFDLLLAQQVPPPYKPELENPRDVRYFESQFTSEMPALTPMNSVLTPSMQEQFRGFSYVYSEQV